jgi:tRNA (cytosine38-C5)-methyltransferase
LPHNDSIIKSLSKVLGPAPVNSISPIRDFLINGTDQNSLNVPEQYVRNHPTYRFDIVQPTSTRSATFTKAYGSSHIIGTGSFLQTKRLEIEYSPNDTETLLTLGLRFFSPTEVGLLHALPMEGNSFTFPTEITVAQQYRLLGNSLNVRVVSRILTHLLRET